MSDQRIKAGTELLDYATDFMKICDILDDAYLKAGVVYSTIDHLNYMGKASEELDVYFTNLMEHIQKISTYYETAANYTIQTYKTLKLTDQFLSDWTEKRASVTGWCTPAGPQYGPEPYVNESIYLG